MVRESLMNQDLKVKNALSVDEQETKTIAKVLY